MLTWFAEAEGRFDQAFEELFSRERSEVAVGIPTSISASCSVKSDLADSETLRDRVLVPSLAAAAKRKPFDQPLFEDLLGLIALSPDPGFSPDPASVKRRADWEAAMARGTRHPPRRSTTKASRCGACRPRSHVRSPRQDAEDHVLHRGRGVAGGLGARRRVARASRGCGAGQRLSVAARRFDSLRTGTIRRLGRTSRLLGGRLSADRAAAARSLCRWRFSSRPLVRLFLRLAGRSMCRCGRALPATAPTGWLLRYGLARPRLSPTRELSSRSSTCSQRAAEFC